MISRKPLDSYILKSANCHIYYNTNKSSFLQAASSQKLIQSSQHQLKKPMDWNLACTYIKVRNVVYTVHCPNMEYNLHYITPSCTLQTLSFSTKGLCVNAVKNVVFWVLT